MVLRIVEKVDVENYPLLPGPGQFVQNGSDRLCILWRDLEPLWAYMEGVGGV
jgi:hypothetical protein